MSSLRLTIAFCVINLSGIGNAFSQAGSYYDNALLYSQPSVSGSARTLGIGGAQAALGADLGSLSSNPAGLGFYRKSEWAINPQFVVPFSSASDGKLVTDDRKLGFVVNNFGVAFCGLRDDIVESKWRGGTFALGYNRISNFQNTVTYQTDNNRSSFADYLVLLANSGYNSDNYKGSEIRSLEDLAYGTYVINPVPIYNDKDSVIGYDPTRFINWLPNGAAVRQSETINTTGGMSEWSAGYGGNYDNKIFFGATLSLVSLRYDQTKSYREALLNNLGQPDILTSMDFNETINNRGSGVNLKIGVTGVVSDYIRTGISFKTPTVLGIRETYNASMSATYKPVYEQSLPSSASKTLITQTNKYTLYTPFVVNWGLAFFFGKAGFLSGEVEYVDFKTASFSGANKINYVTTNQNIKKTLVDVVNFKLGAELRADIIRFRAGYAYQPTGYQKGVPIESRRVRSGDMSTFTLGLGIRTDEFFFDIAFARSQYSNTYSPYYMPINQGDTRGSEPVISIENKLTNITLGAGFFF